eukprot:9064057-Pyramimonas_sp.AAC.1
MLSRFPLAPSSNRPGLVTLWRARRFRWRFRGLRGHSSLSGGGQHEDDRESSRHVHSERATNILILERTHLAIILSGYDVCCVASELR